MRRCPYCDQVLPEYRLGIRLPPIPARIFDLVLRGGRDGIAAEDLWSLTYNGSVRDTKGLRSERNRKTLKAHIWRINDLLEDAEPPYRIISSSGAYKLEKK
jgi:hypothetical protein